MLISGVCARCTGRWTAGWSRAGWVDCGLARRRWLVWLLGEAQRWRRQYFRLINGRWSSPRGSWVFIGLSRGRGRLGLLR